MSEVRVIDLKLRLGFPYIFVHQGHCEHLMIFTDLRLMNVNDNHRLDEYPVTIYDAVHSANCCACKEAAAA
jgi:snRNA-activating protein complex subunit 3